MAEFSLSAKLNKQDIEARMMALTDRYRDMQDISLHSLDSKHTWTDLQPEKLICFQLKKYSAESLYTLAVNTFEEMHTCLTTQTVAKLLMLSYNLRDVEGRELFGPTEPELVDKAQQRQLEDLAGDVVLQRAHDVCPVIYYGNSNTAPGRARIANALCFLATSFLRLFTKSSDNFAKIGQQLQKRFADFFGYALPVSTFMPLTTVIESIRDCFSRHSIIKQTFYVLLYSGEETETGMDLKEFLYKYHISYTGMHCYRLFIRCMEVFKVSHEHLAECLHSGTWIRNCDLKSLGKLFQNCVTNASDGNRLQMWKYARIFDKSFFVELQTKNCTTLTAVLAYMLKDEKAEANGEDLLKITQISSLPEEAKKFAMAYAKKARSVIQGSHPISTLAGQEKKKRVRDDASVEKRNIKKKYV